MLDLFIKIEKEIANNNDIAIFTHAHPDGDCYGTGFGLKYAIQKKYPNKKVVVLGEDLPRYIKFLGPKDEANDDFIKNSLAIAVDTASRIRIADQRFKLAKKLIKIDHHLLGESYGDIEWVHVSSSCAENVADFLFNQGYEIDEKIAIPLLTGMVTDNGRFLYRGVNSKTFAITKNFYELNINPLEEIYKHIYSKPISEIPFHSWYLSNIQFYKSFAYSVVRKEDMDRMNVNRLDCPGWLIHMANLEGIDVWCQFIDYDDHFRCEFRSVKTNISEIARKFGGGGHFNASGAKVKTIAEVQEIIEYIKTTIN